MKTELLGTSDKSKGVQQSNGKYVVPVAELLPD